MADIVVTAANVIRGPGSNLITGTAGAAITAGQAVKLDGNGNYVLASAATAEGTDGIALNNAAINQPVSVANTGRLKFGGGLTAGVGIYLSPTPGGLILRTDASLIGSYVCLLGFAHSTSEMDIDIEPSDVIAA